MGRRFHLLLVFLITILLPLIFGIGCSGSGGSGKGEPSNTISRKLFVANVTGDRISIFDANASGNAAPTRSIGSNTRLIGPRGISVDTENNEIFVTNENNTITVYRTTDKGDAAPLRTISGLNTRLSGPQGIFVDTKNNEIFVANNSSNEITVYGRTDEGNVTPSRTIGGSNTGLVSPVGIFVDTKYDEIFVANQQFNQEILVYKSTDKGDVTPLRIISISELSEEGIPFLPTAIFVDTENDELYISNSFSRDIVSPVPIEGVGEDTIKVYSRTAEGNTPSLRTIGGPNTELFNVSGIFVDPKNDEILLLSNTLDNSVIVFGRTDTGDVPPLRTLIVLDSNHSGVFHETFALSSGIFVDIYNNEIFVANRNDTITVYGRTDEGNANPLRIIGSKTGLLSPKWIYPDTKNNEIFVSNLEGESNFSHGSDLTTVYGITDEGNAAPLRTISHSLVAPEGIFVDTTNDELFIAYAVGTEGLSWTLITANRRTDEGNAVPLRNIVGTNPGLSFPEDVFVDTENNEIFVTVNDTITVYGRTDDGDVPPLRTIEGPDTGLATPSGIFVDTDNNEIFVANSGNDTITVYGRTDEGDVSPLRTIEGLDTGLSEPGGISVDVENSEIFVSNSGNDTITVYGRADNGNTPPLRTIGGENTGLATPWGIFVTESP